MVNIISNLNVEIYIHHLTLLSLMYHYLSQHMLTREKNYNTVSSYVIKTMLK